MNYNTRKTETVLKGVKYGELTTVRRTDKRKNGRVLWECKCSCGKAHLVAASNLKSGRVKSCGCLIANRTKVNEKKFGRLKPIEMVKREGSQRNFWRCICDCGEETVVSTSNLNKGHTKSCGCLRDEAVTGEGSRFYNPDLTDEERLLNNRYESASKNIYKWRKLIYEKNDYTCQNCSKRGGDLNAHHLDGWHWCKEKRFDVENGATLCVSCHRAFHAEYGIKDNTKQQFLAFLKQ